MSDCLEPQRVSIRDIPHWARESWQLLWRRPLGFFAASLLYHGLALSSQSVPWVSLLLSVLLGYMLLLTLIVGAEATDHHRLPAPAGIYAMLRRVIVSLTLLAAFYVAIFIVAAVLAALLLPSVPEGGQAARESLALLRWLEPGELSFMILFMGIIVTSMWFLAPLLALHELGLRDARGLARRAFDKNDIVVLVASNVPFFGILGGALITELSVALSPLLVPWFAIYQYVAYRHVFLGRRQNAPQPATSALGETAFN